MKLLQKHMVRRLNSVGAALLVGMLTAPACAQEAVQAVPTSHGISIQDTINATLESHKALRVIQENREVVGHELDRVWRGYGPSIDINGAAGVGVLSNSTTRSLGVSEGFYGATRIGATLVQPLWDGFATRSRVRNAQATYDSMTSRVFDNATTLSLDAVIAHIDVIRRREIYDLSLANVTRHEEILVQARDRESLGADTMADVTQAESRLSRALSSLVEARAALREGEDTYARITGMRVSDNLLPITEPDALFGAPIEVMEEALRSNPKLAAYLQDTKAAIGNKELAESTYHPIINLEAGPQYTDRGGKGSQWTYSFDVMATLRWNVFNSGADVAAVKAADGRVRQSRQFMNNFADDLALEIDNTWTELLSAREQYKHYMDAVGYNTVTRDAYQEQFILGQRSLLDVLDADSELFNSSTQAATAQGNVLVGTYRLLALAGVLLPRLDIDDSGIYEPPVPAPVDPREKW